MAAKCITNASVFATMTKNPFVDIKVSILYTFQLCLCILSQMINVFYENISRNTHIEFKQYGKIINDISLLNLLQLIAACTIIKGCISRKDI